MVEGPHSSSVAIKLQARDGCAPQSSPHAAPHPASLCLNSAHEPFSLFYCLSSEGPGILPKLTWDGMGSSYCPGGALEAGTDLRAQPFFPVFTQTKLERAINLPDSLVLLLPAPPQLLCSVTSLTLRYSTDFCPPPGLQSLKCHSTLLTGLTGPSSPFSGPSTLCPPSPHQGHHSQQLWSSVSSVHHASLKLEGRLKLTPVKREDFPVMNVKQI